MDTPTTTLGPDPAVAVPLPETSSRTEWLELRRTGIGSSDASTVVGLNPYASPYTLWLEKTGQVPMDPPRSERQEEILQWGNLLEPVVREEVARRLGIEIFKPEVGHRSAERPWQHANLDGWTEDGRVAEFKTTNERNAWLWDGQVPDHAEIQVSHAAAVTGAEHAVVAGLIGGQRLSIHEITINPNVVEMIVEAEARFWEHVVNDTPPPMDGHVATMDALTREWAHKPGVREVSESEVEAYWQEWNRADKAEREASERKRAAAAELAALMDGHDALVTGGRTWARAQRGQLSERRLAEAHPDLVAKYTTAVPKLDRAKLREDHPDIYAAFQTVSIRPKQNHN